MSTAPRPNPTASVEQNPKPVPAATIESLLIGDRDTAKLLGLGVRTLHRLRAGGEVPAPLKLGGRVLWRRLDIESFVELGCDMPRWKALQARRGGR